MWLQLDSQKLYIGLREVHAFNNWLPHRLSCIALGLGGTITSEESCTFAAILGLRTFGALQSCLAVRPSYNFTAVLRLEGIECNDLCLSASQGKLYSVLLN